MQWLQEETDLEITNMQMHYPGVYTDGRLVQHYEEHEGKDFYQRLTEFMRSGPLVAIAGETEDILNVRSAVKRFRDSWHSRGSANLLHCSDSAEAGKREAKIWFD